MQPTLCSKCKKYVAVVYISKMGENGKPVNEGLCLRCAKALGLPQVDEMMKRMGISDDELEKINEEMMQAFGGVESLENLPMDLNDADDDESDEGKTATFPFLNRLFGGEGVRGEGAGSEAEAEEPRPHAPKKGGKRKRRTIFLPALLGITVAFALACMALCWMILNDSSNLMNNKADVTLGDYIGMTKDQAMATDQIASGQISPEWEEEYNSNYAAGYIYKQSPVSGRTVREGQSVTLTVSLGTQYVTVPDLTNYVQTDAEQQLKALGVSVLVTQAVDTSVASGAVIRTDPAAGTQVAAGSTVILYISRPQVSTTTKVPSLTGMSVDDARTLLVQNHLGLGSQTDQYSDQPVGTVIGQNPAAGSTAKLNGRVNITVSAGPEPAPVEPEAPSDSGSDWWGSLWGGDSSSSSGSSSSTETGESASSSEGSGLADWWASLLG